jgi:hypothetical protein
MFKRLCSFVSATGLAFVGMGCSEGAFSFNYSENEPPRHVTVVQVEQGHVCTPACAHYYDGARYVVIRGRHHHGPGCGHVFEGSRWVIVVAKGRDTGVVEVHKAPATRVHPTHTRVVEVAPCPGPVHLYVFDRHGSKWLKVAKGHSHGPGCGHVHVEGRWSLP